MSSKGLWMVVLALAVAAPAAAEPASSGRSAQAGLFVGGNGFTDDNELGNAIYAFPEQVPRSAVLFGARGSLVLVPDLAPATGLHPQLGVEVEAKLALASTGSAEGRRSYSAPVLGLRALARLALWPQHKLSPFAVLGIGGETLFSNSPAVDSGDTDAAVQWGIGASYRVAPRLDLRVDLRHGITAGREDLLASTVELHVGASYRFEWGGRGPTIGKKVMVAEPPPPAAPTGPSDLDQDGLPDSEDGCPKQPEIFNDIDDTDGCPEIDSDGDGLLGSADGCPDGAEDVDGYQDEDGCPDPDNDKDGRPDFADQCPSDAETLNGFQDDDGCPDQIPATLARFTGVMKGIQFKTGSARITAGSKKTLDETVKILTKFPSIRLEISGHTDNQGKREVNLDLSRKRADYVKWYLVDKGIDARRIETEGVGPDQPIGDNKSTAGRRKNRRIEFELLPGDATVADPRAAQPDPAADAPTDSADPATDSAP